MNISLDPKLLEAIQSLAAKLGTTVEYLLGVMKRQAVTEATMGLVWGIILFLGSMAFLARCIVLARRGRDDDGDSAALLLGLAVVLFLWASFDLFKGAKGLLNPDYYALKLLFQTIGLK